MKSLFEPLRFRNGVQAPNRIVLAAMTNMQSHADGTLSDDELHWLALRAKGGFGVVTTCATHVARDGQGWVGELGIFDDAHIPGFKRIAEMVRASGGISLAQIFHGGLRADPALTGQRTWSASDGGADGARAATAADIERVIGEFTAAACRVHAAGMEGVELHGAHGYLFGQFLSVIENRRDDEWGGSLENRARLLRRTMQSIRKAVPAHFVVGVRLSPEDWGQSRGLDLDETLQVARWLVEDGADFLHLSLWTASNNTKKRPQNHPLTEFRAVVPDSLPLLAAGKIWTRADADHILQLGADGVALGRSAIANPDWGLRVADSAWAPKRTPLTAAELRERGLNEGFVRYMSTWKGFVAA
ncbi:MAG: NADH:flavin oxidoreductase [Nevskia sp.]|nr:NADH:flavin oxidoreductase [Nevskia sp.]